MNLSFVLPTLFSLKYTIKPGRHYNFVTEKFATRVARRDTLIYTVTLSYLKKKKKKYILPKLIQDSRFRFEGTTSRFPAIFLPLASRRTRQAYARAYFVDQLAACTWAVVNN